MARRVAVAVLAGLLAWPAQSALAQGLLQQLFGSGSQPPPRLYGYPGAAPNRSLYVWPSPRPFGSDPLDRRDEGTYGRAGTYRTLCVRLCDGFYFPVSSATTGSGLSRDADSCSASCGTEARLFYYPNAGGDVETMTDLTGLAYSALPNAFRYRKALVPECRCRSQPWSDAELQRHRTYAGGKSTATDTGSQTPRPTREASSPASDAPPTADRSALVAGPATVPPGDQPFAVERPEPVVRDAGQPRPAAAPGSGGATRSRYTWPSGR
jgi:Protein of unknown function (DUF2865)